MTSSESQNSVILQLLKKISGNGISKKLTQCCHTTVIKLKNETVSIYKSLFIVVIPIMCFLYTLFNHQSKNSVYSIYLLEISIILATHGHELCRLIFIIEKKYTNRKSKFNESTLKAKTI